MCPGSRPVQPRFARTGDRRLVLSAARRRMLRTVVASHSPPRAVAMPRAFSAVAGSCRVGEASRRRALRGQCLGNGSPINPFTAHDGNQLTTLLVGRRGLALGRLGVRPGGQPGDSDCARPGSKQKLDQSNGVIHPKEVDPAIEKPVPKTGDFERDAAARDFRRRSGSAAKMNRPPCVLGQREQEDRKAVQPRFKQAGVAR